MIDAHFHCWQLARNDYGWLTPELAPIYRDVSVADWQQQAQAWGVPAGGATVFGANGGGLVTGAGGNTPEGITLLVAGGEQGMVGAGMMLETEGISVLAGEKDSVMQAPTGVEHAGGA